MSSDFSLLYPNVHYMNYDLLTIYPICKIAKLPLETYCMVNIHNSVSADYKIRGLQEVFFFLFLSTA